MNPTDRIIVLAKENNGTVTTSMVVEAGVSRGNLDYLLRKGTLERVARGIYMLPEGWEDELFNLQNRFKRGIYSLETAMFLWDLTDRTPQRYTMTFPDTYNLARPKEENIKCVQCKDMFYTMGITQVITPAGNQVTAYNMERTLCDVLRVHNHVDIQIVTDGFKRYAKRTDKNIPLLSEYAEYLHVDKRLRSYLEVLL